MKVLLFAILDHVPASEQLIRSLSKEGYNGTVIPTEGMHHVFPEFHEIGAGIGSGIPVELRLHNAVVFHGNTNHFQFLLSGVIMEALLKQN